MEPVWKVTLTAVSVPHPRAFIEALRTDDDAVFTGKIALAHLNEFPDYYTRLERMEEEAKREHGSPGA